ncbi:hypothetical protein [Sutcliffiella horikoshii]|uniref:hypothetical protein n=1 Tax=Sutcliffiella horikoshii TaxID=79883 RepID=UPI00384ADD5B
MVEEIMRGSKAAMEVLTRRYNREIFAFVYRKVGNIGRVGDGVFDLRILSDSKPHPAAVNEAPNLEDLYLYYFDGEAAS